MQALSHVGCVVMVELQSGHHDAPYGAMAISVLAALSSDGEASNETEVPVLNRDRRLMVTEQSEIWDPDFLVFA